MKKSLTVLAILILSATYGFSQFEIKTNPISLIFGTIPLSAEYVITDNMGVEATAGYYFRTDNDFESDTKWAGLNTNIKFKYYFVPDKGGDKFYAFPYLRYVHREGSYTDETGDYSITQNVIGAGFGAGYKWVAESGLLFELGAGIGRNFSNEITYSDPDYDDSSVDLSSFNINFIARISLGYRF